jgi:hypothetical protein
MQDVITMLQNTHRPRLMMRAARAGAETYRREAHLPRLLGYGTLPRHGQALMKLMELEADQDKRRRAGDAGYSLLRHIELLIAMVGEARVLRAAQSAPATPAQVVT